MITWGNVLQFWCEFTKFAESTDVGELTDFMERRLGKPASKIGLQDIWDLTCQLVLKLEDSKGKGSEDTDLKRTSLRLLQLTTIYKLLCNLVFGEEEPSESEASSERGYSNEE
jgi:hypothetical protein